MVRKSLSLIILADMVFCIGLWGGDLLALTNAVKIGNPGLEQFPTNSIEDCFARSIWDMYCYNGSIYVGMGDYWSNMGPIDVWSFDASGVFTNEYTVDDEHVWLFREYDGKLFIPGSDATESWDFGNLYIKDSGSWQKLRTIPRGLHVTDIAIFRGNIYVTISSEGYSELLESSDMGQTWKSIYRNNSIGSLGRMTALDDCLFLMERKSSGEYCSHRYVDGNMETSTIPFSPGLGSIGIGVFSRRLVIYGDGVLYLGYSSEYSSYVLFFLDDSGNRPVDVKEFRQKNVRDILVRNNTCYMLTASEKEGVFGGSIYSSSDLELWTRVGEFSVPALPDSFELLDGVFYVGLRGRKAESGSIYRLDMEAPPWDVDRDGVVGISDFAILGQHFGKTLTTPLEPDPDVNADGKVSILDVVLVGQHFGETYLPAMPSKHIWKVDPEYLPDLIKIYDAICYAPNSDPAFLTTKRLLGGFIFNTEIAETRAFQNYPNPFNPETWMPYQLWEDADVSISIYDTTGQLIRALNLGYKSAGLYADRGKAAYWDGVNEAGEQVASGVYFYAIRAGDVTARRKMLMVR